MYPAQLLTRHPERLRRVARLEHAVAGCLEHVAGEGANLVFIFQEEDCLRAALSSPAVWRGPAVFGNALDAGQVNSECAPLPRLALGGDGSQMLSHNSV